MKIRTSKSYYLMIKNGKTKEYKVDIMPEREWIIPSSQSLITSIGPHALAVGPKIAWLCANRIY